MAKLTTKFVTIPVRVDAKVLVGGKKKNASATGVGKSIKPVLQGINRLGKTLESRSNQTSETTEKLKATSLGLQDFEERRKELNKSKDEYLDLVTSREESKAPASKPGKRKSSGLKPSPEIKKAVDKEGKGLGKGLLTLGKFLGGLKGILGKAFFVTAGLAALKWFADPENSKKVDDIVKGLEGVFGFVAKVANVVGGLVVGGIVNLGSGLGKIFGSGGDPKEILSGFGDLLQAIPGLFTIAWILKPGLMLKTILKILNGFREPKDRDLDKKDDKKKKKDPKKPDKPKVKKKSFFERQKDKLRKQRNKLSKKFSGISDRIGQTVTSARKGATQFVSDTGKRIQSTATGAMEGLSDTGKRITSFVANLSEQGQKRWAAFTEFAGENWKKLSKTYNETIGAAGEAFGNFTKKQSKNLLEWAAKRKGIIGLIAQSVPGLAEKLGKYLPFVGDITGFIIDIFSGVDWRRALIRALVGATIDAGFTAIMTALGLGAPFTGGASGIAATALYVAYMGADLAAGGFGNVIGDQISDALGIPMRAGEDPSAENVKPKVGGDSEIEEAKNAVAAKDPDFAAKVAEKEAKLKGNSAEDGGILSPEGKKPLPFGAATTSKNRDDIRDLIGLGSTYSNQSLRGLLKEAIKQQKIFADTTYEMNEMGIFEQGLQGRLDFGSGVVENVTQGAEKLLSVGSTFAGNLGAAFGIGDGEYGEAPLKSAAEAAGIQGKELAAFLAQMSHESGQFKYKTEIGGGKDSYDGGKRYKGRGYIQLTHKYNYKYYGDKLGLDLVNKPELAEAGETAAKIALLYWTENVRPTVNGDWDNVFLHSKAINYPAAKQPSDVNGMEDRQAKYDAYIKKLGLDEKSSGGKVKQWQSKQEAPAVSSNSPKNLTPFEVPGWDEFSIGGEYQNGKLPKSVLRKVDAYGYGEVGHGYMHSSVSDQAQSMIDAAKAAGHNLGINSTYRSYQAQVAAKAKHGNAAAAPGTSNHGWGQAVDLWYSDAGYKWLWKNASKFGFKHLEGWGLSPNTPDATEAWHWENLSGGGAKGDNVKTEPADDMGDGSGSTPPTPKGNTDTSEEESRTKKAKLDPFAALAAALNAYKGAVGFQPTTMTTPEGLEGKSVGGEFDLEPTVNVLKGSSETLGKLTQFIPVEIQPAVTPFRSSIDLEVNRVENIDVSISNMQVKQTQNLLDKSKTVVAEKKSRKGSATVINTRSQVRQHVFSGTNSFAVHTGRKHTKFF